MSDETATHNPEETVQEFQQQDLINIEPAADQLPAEEPASVEVQQEEKKRSRRRAIAKVQGAEPREMDRARDYAQVYGMPGIVYEQDHTYFDFDGFEVKPAQEA